MNIKIYAFLSFASILLSGCSSNKIDADDGSFYVLINPDKTAGIYLDGEKIADAKELILTERMSKKMLSKDGGDPKPFDPFDRPPYTAPKPKPCGDMGCPDPKAPKPEPSPSPSPVCHTPDCSKGAIYKKNNQVIIYRDFESRPFPEQLKPKLGY